MNRISYSKGKQHQGCPRSYKLERIDEIKQVPSELCVVGGGFHQVSEVYAKHLVNTGQQSDLSAVGQMLQKGLAGNWPGSDEIPNTYTGDPKDWHGPEAVPAQYRGAVAEVAAPWLENFFLEDPKKVIGAEHWIEVDLGDLVFAGKLDLLIIDGLVAIVRDYKSGWHISSQSALNTDLQGKLYAWAVFMNYPKLEEVQVVWEFPRYGAERTVAFKPEDVKGGEDQVRAMNLEIQKATDEDCWPATPGAGCDWCGSTGDCPALELAQKLDPSAIPDVITSAEQAKREVEQIILGSAVIAARKKTLRIWCATHGHVILPGLAYGHHVSPSVSYDAKTVYDMSLKDPALIKYLTVDGKKAKGLPQELRDSLEEADAITETKKTTFDKRKV